ncbi:MAG: HlyC/CorC family transporter [Planctomycetales bacterium]|nr:HlyC/CorC family transporter [Planctomycetales bacterium]
MTGGSLVLFFCIGVFVTFVSAVALRAMQEVAWHDLQDYCKRRNRDHLFNEIHENADNAPLAIESTQIVGVLFSTIIAIGWYLDDHAAHHLTGAHLGPVLFFGTLIYFATTLWVPREIAYWFGAAYLTETWPVWRLVIWLFKPFEFLSRLLEIMFLRASGESQEKAKERELEEEIRSLVLDGEHEKSLPQILRKMIEGVIELDDMCANDIMRHRSEIDGINAAASYNEVVLQVVACGRTRLPVYEKNVDDIIGTLYVKDLLKAISEGRQIQDVREILRPHYEVPETVSLHELLAQFLHDKAHQAIVVDEFNATIGLVTIEDILEEIVGEIVDESEADEEEDITHISSTVISILADTHIDEINERIFADLPSGVATHLEAGLPVEDDYNTLGGFVIKQLKDIPKPGTTMTWNGLLFQVEEATRRQVKRVRITLEVEPDTDELRGTTTQVVSNA